MWGKNWQSRVFLLQLEGVNSLFAQNVGDFVH